MWYKKCYEILILIWTFYVFDMKPIRLHIWKFPAFYALFLKALNRISLRYALLNDFNHASKMHEEQDLTEITKPVYKKTWCKAKSRTRPSVTPATSKNLASLRRKDWKKEVWEWKSSWDRNSAESSSSNMSTERFCCTYRFTQSHLKWVRRSARRAEIPCYIEAGIW